LEIYTIKDARKLAEEMNDFSFLDTVDSVPIVTIHAFTAVTWSAILTKRV